MTQALKDYEGLAEDGIIEKWFSKESLENGIIKTEDLINKLNLDNLYREKFEKDLLFINDISVVKYKNICKKTTQNKKNMLQ